MRALSRRIVWAALVALLTGMGLTLVNPATSPAVSPTVGRFELVGSSDLLGRGMNAALAVHGDYAYVGSRTDGSHPNSGILVVDISRPTRPEVVHQIGPPDAGNLGETSRELRVWPDRDLLVVLNFECNPAGHLCPASEAIDVSPTVRFFDIRGDRAWRPRLVSTYHLPDTPHEFFLWDDPRVPGRALLYVTTAYQGSGADIDHEEPHLLVTDISRARQGEFRELARWSPDRDPRWDEAGLHSLSLSRNGRRAYLADLEGGFLMANTRQLAEGRLRPRIRQLTPASAAVHHEAPGAHSAVPLPGRPFAMVTDEVYGRGGGLGPAIGYNMLLGCPWGWARLVDVRDPRAPSVVGEYKASPWNDASRCSELSPLDREGGASYSSHNPTVTRHLGLVSWHSAGLHAADLADPSSPRTTAVFSPEPRTAVVTEDPVLSSGGSQRTVVWSYPVVQDGLIFVVDVRNGLYVLRYHGPHADELRCRTFIEGNSNLGRRIPDCGR